MYFIASFFVVLSDGRHPNRLQLSINTGEIEWDLPGQIKVLQSAMIPQRIGLIAAQDHLFLCGTHGPQFKEFQGNHGSRADHQESDLGKQGWTI